MIIVGNALDELKHMETESIDCCVTSPPYYNLRDYGIEGQIGLETTPDEYISKLVDVFREVRRILKKDGTLWLNIGDSYAGSGKGKKDTHTRNMGNKGTLNNSALQGNFRNEVIKPKDLIGIPWLLAFALRADGWYLRQDIIWSKSNCMPESVRDRCTRSHEYIFLLSKSRKYYYDSEAIMEKAVTSDRSFPRGSKGTFTPNTGRRKQEEFGNRRYTGFNERYFAKVSPLKRNKRDVWNVPTCGFKGAHFAVFPEKLIEPCVLAGCPNGGTVLDPFCGSGTTGVAAAKNNRKFVGIELNPEYADLARKRISDTKNEPAPSANSTSSTGK